MNATAGSGWKWLEVRTIIGLHLKRFRNIHNLRLTRAADGLLGETCADLCLWVSDFFLRVLWDCVAQDLVPVETVCERHLLVQGCTVAASRKHWGYREAQSNLRAKQIRRRFAGQANGIPWEVGAHADGVPNWQARGPGMVSVCCSRWPSPWSITGADFVGLGRVELSDAGRRTPAVGRWGHPGWCVLFCCHGQRHWPHACANFGRFWWASSLSNCYQIRHHWRRELHRCPG